ncbi:unnamed protein product [Symbiodinium pilosum]|uniref:Uncharacterized protein n=1 Tax=Symbiodinium pilosum TaxID=2952 RepID=A0A812QRG0_SYMPI|nr:unnamed protein product [Symbiodinium pilosum]
MRSLRQLARLHRKSKATESIDEFWSHSWQKRPYQKILCLLFLKNSIAASFVGTIAASIVFILMQHGFLLLRLSDDTTSGGEPYGSAFLCTVTGTFFAVLTLFAWRSRTKVFLDVCCIDQVNNKNKQEGILSLGGILSSCKTLLILWDETYIERLWCVFEIAAFAHRSGNPCTAIKPTLLGKAALTVYAATPAMGLLWLETMHMRKYGEISLYVMLGAFVVYFYAGVASFRSYHYSIETLRKQLQNFRLADTKCNCCTLGHVAPDGRELPCDRQVVERCICNWFGSVDEFEVFIVPLLRNTFENQLGHNTFPYIYFMVVFCPVFWTGMDLTAGHRWGSWWMFQCTGFWLGVMPATAKIGLYLCSYFCRPRKYKVCDLVLNLAIVLVMNGCFVASLFAASLLNPRGPRWVDEYTKDMTLRAFLPFGYMHIHYIVFSLTNSES